MQTIIDLFGTNSIYFMTTVIMIFLVIIFLIFWVSREKK